MSRSLFIVLAVLALFVSVSAQSSSSSSSTGSWYNKLSSSSSSLVAAASTGSSTDGGSPDAYPSGSYSLSFVAVFTTVVTQSNAAATAVLVKEDIAFNIANSTGANASIVAEYVVITSIAGYSLAPASRRLLQNSQQQSITFVLLGNITSAITTFSPSTAVTAFVAAAEAGTLSAPNTGASIPTQTPTTVPVGSTPSSSSSTGLQDSGASSVASASAALLFAAAASLALLL